MAQRPAPPVRDPLAAPGEQGRGWLQGLDPRAKLPVALAFTLLVALAHETRLPLAGLLVGLGLALTTGIAWPVWLRRLVAVNFFVAFLWVFLPWRLGWAGGWFTWTHNPAGLALAALITLKVNAIVLVTLSLLGTSRVDDILHAMAHFRLPAKLITIFMLFHRYLHLIYQEYRRLVQAMRMRCFTPGTNRHTYRTYAYLLGMLLVRGFDRAERVYQAMLCRGFCGTFWVWDHFAWQRRDTVFCLAAGGIMLVLAALPWLGSPWN